MSKWHKETNPVDRALSDINRKIESVERQLRDMGHNTGNKPAALSAPPAAPEAPGKSVKQFVKEMLTPPARRATTPARSTRRDLFDATDPMKELEEEPITFAQTPAPDLFAAAAAPVAKSAAAAANAGEKLAHYLAAGTLKIPKPTLKRVQRKNRNHFFMWMGFAGLIVLWLIIVATR